MGKQHSKSFPSLPKTFKIDKKGRHAYEWEANYWAINEKGISICDLDTCDILNMLWYIVGEEELYSMFENCEEWDELWNEQIGEMETKVLVAWLKDNEKV